MSHALHHGDCLEIMPTLEADSADTIICDPPAGIAFMGKRWDDKSSHAPKTMRGATAAIMLDMMVKNDLLQKWEAGFLLFTVDWASAALRVAKPGASALVWAIPRTSDLTKFGLRLAGWEIYDTIYWLYGQGFPKSKNISKDIDKAAGAEREVVGYTRTKEMNYPGTGAFSIRARDGIDAPSIDHPVTAPATDAAKEWHGWGTALKPAAEEWIVAMKPREGTYANNALQHGVAGLWIDGGRVGTTVETWPASRSFRSGISPGYTNGIGKGPTQKTGDTPPGRWPANLIHDGSDEVVALFPETSSHGGGRSSYGGVFGNGGPAAKTFASSGSAARFFYTAKASKSERTCDGTVENKHPTVKPLALMQYLCRLTKTPTGGTVLDPFMGSGSTGAACVLEGRDFIGIEQDPDSFQTAEQRINYYAKQERQLDLL